MSTTALRICCRVSSLASSRDEPNTFATYVCIIDTPRNFADDVVRREVSSPKPTSHALSEFCTSSSHCDARFTDAWSPAPEYSMSTAAAASAHSALRSSPMAKHVRDLARSTQAKARKKCTLQGASAAKRVRSMTRWERTRTYQAFAQWCVFAHTSDVLGRVAVYIS